MSEWRARQKAKAKSKKAILVARIVRLVRKHGLSYGDWQYVARRVRNRCDLHPAKKSKKLPRVLTADEFRRFYRIVDQADNVQHALMLRLLFYTGVRVSELCNLRVEDVDLENCKIRVNQGKGGKDRFVLFGRAFATTLRTHIAANPDNRWLFQTRRNSKFSARRVQQVVKHYAGLAGVRASPHTIRHQSITWLTKTSGLSDAELQLITGHSRRETLAIYQHIAVDGEMAEKYQRAVQAVEI
jgi:integrase/recombinase XerD